MYTKLSLFLLALLFPLLAYSANPLNFKRISGESGLRSNYVNQIIQRQDGFIWMATADGLSRYDGNNFINLTNDPDDPTSLPHSWVSSLLEDHQKQLWVGTSTGLARLMPNERQFVQYLHSPTQANSLGGNQINGLFEDQQNRLWILTSKGLSLYREESNSFKNFTLAPAESSEQDRLTINFIIQANEQQLWLGTDNGLYLFDINSATFTLHELPGLTNKEIQFLDGAKDSKGALWLATQSYGVFHYNLNEKTLINYRYQTNNPLSINSDNITNILVDSKDNVWLGSWGQGISRIEPSTGNIVRNKHNVVDERSIPNNLTCNIYQDKNGLIWIATYDGVATHQQDNPIEVIRAVPGEGNTLSVDTVWSFVESDGAIWVGTTEGLNRWDLATGKIDNYFSGIDSDEAEKYTAVWSMEKAGENKLWLGTEFGIALFNTQTHELNYLHQMITDQQMTQANNENNEAENKRVRNLLQSAVWVINKNSDDTLWVGTGDSNLFLVDQKMGLIKDHSPIVSQTLAIDSSIQFTNIVEDSEKNIWLATAQGLFFFNTQLNSITPAKNASGDILFEKDWVYSMQHHSANQYWISSQFNGLTLLELNTDGTSNSVFHLDKNYPNMADNSVYSVYPINQNEVWFTAKKNIYRLTIDSGYLENFGRSFLPSDIIFHENTQFYDQNGKLYFGSNRGAIRFDPQQIKKPNQQYPTYFTSIESNSLIVATSSFSSEKNQSKTNQKIIESDIPVHQLIDFTFPCSDKIFSFGFATLDYASSETLNYAYRLTELSDDWVLLNNKHEITFTNLAAGDYQLEIKATHTDMDWNKEQATLFFTVLAKPWQTWWAYCFYLLIFSVTAIFIYRFWRKNLLTKYELNHTETLLSQALWGSGDELWEWNIEQQKINRKNSLNKLSERGNAFTGAFNPTSETIHPQDIKSLQIKINDILSGKTAVFEAIYRQKDCNGNWMWLLDRAKVSKWADNKQPLIVSGISRDINSLKEKEEKSRLIASAFESSSDGTIVFDAKLKIISINAALTKITGFDERIFNKTMSRESGILSAEGMDNTSIFTCIKNSILSTGAYQGELMVSTVTGDQVPVDLRVGCIFDSNSQPTHYIATLTDIRFRKQAEQELRQLANFDSLTGLPNRSLMMHQLSHAILQAERDNKMIAVMFIDLDHFKNVNDSLGHSVGDELLIDVASRISQCIRATDLVARIGGDEFTIALLSVEDINDIIKIAEIIIKKLAKPFILKNHELIISPSIGIAVYSSDGKDVETLLKHADTAMYHAKRNGRNNYQFFTESLNQRVINRIYIETKLRKALTENQLVLFYQPKYELIEGEITGFEALIRWQDPLKGLIAPDIFIPVAEETGLIIPIGEFVLDTACRQLKDWIAQGFTNINIAVNLSALQFMDQNLVELVTQTINKYQISASSLELEITESTLIGNMDYTIKTLHKLRELGVRLSLDDFGTGFSSLNYLKQFPIHTLKIDRSFIKDITTDSRDAQMVESIVSLAHKLSVSVIVEGVELEQQLKLIKKFKAEEVQGFLLSKPLPAKNASELLIANLNIKQVLQNYSLLNH